MRKPKVHDAAAKRSVKPSTTNKKAAATSGKSTPKRAGNNTPGSTAIRARSGSRAKPTLLSGGNPQIAKGYGDAPVQAYIAAMPGWKRDLGHRLDGLITRAVPSVAKAVKWNSPFYGAGEAKGGAAGKGERRSWFLSFHCFTRYVKVAFFNGASLKPVPPGASKQKDVRYLDIHEHDELDEGRFIAWVKQASALPGERM